MTVFTAGLQFKKIGLDQQRKYIVICMNVKQLNPFL